jgi:hypothetical protein
VCWWISNCSSECLPMKGRLPSNIVPYQDTPYRRGIPRPFAGEAWQSACAAMGGGGAVHKDVDKCR